MLLKNTVSTKIDDATLFVLNNLGKQNDWELSKTIRNVLTSYIKEHNLNHLFTPN